MSTREPYFETERLNLRPYTMADLEAAHEALDTDPDVWRFDPGRPLTLDERRGALERRISGYGAPVFGALAVILKESDALIGYAGLQLYLCERLPFSTPEVELFYKLGRRDWSHGYAAEACQELLRYAFGELRLERVVTCTHRENTRSIALLRRLGMAVEPDGTDPNGVLATLWNPQRQSSPDTPAQ